MPKEEATKDHYCTRLGNPFPMLRSADGLNRFFIRRGPTTVPERNPTTRPQLLARAFLIFL